jgi:hypothetical protein
VFGQIGYKVHIRGFLSGGQIKGLKEGVSFFIKKVAWQYTLQIILGLCIPQKELIFCQELQDPKRNYKNQI